MCGRILLLATSVGAIGLGRAWGGPTTAPKGEGRNR